jgi:hypothetical protein
VFEASKIELIIRNALINVETCGTGRRSCPPYVVDPGEEGSRAEPQMLSGGIFTLRKTELDFFYQDGTSRRFKETPNLQNMTTYFPGFRRHSPRSIVSSAAPLSAENLTHCIRSEEYLAPVPENERGDMVKAYHKLLNSEDDNVRYGPTLQGGRDVG